MAGGKLPPRQKMINMMYLVLTALLALNVSKDILKAFHVVEMSMRKSGNNIEEKNQKTMAAFKKSMQDFPEKTKDFYAKAQECEKISKDMVKYLEEVKTVLITQTEGHKSDDENMAVPEEDRELAQPDNIEKHAFYFIKENGGARGKELKQKINETRTKLLNCLVKKDGDKVVPFTDKEKAEVKNDLYTEDPKGASGQTWESEMFEHAPLAAVVTMFTKMQNDVRNLESQVLDRLIKNIDANDFKFDQLRAAVIPTKGTFILIGNEYTADIFIAASSSQQDAEVLVDGSKVPVEGGIGKYKFNPSSEGEGKKKVIINVKDPSGKVVPYESEITYTAFKGVATISAEKMNVLYVGLENPVSVSVPGTSPDQLVVTAPGAKISGAKGKYIVEVTQGTREVEIVASIKSKTDNSVKRIEAKKYRVKQVPSPTPKIGAIDGNTATPTEVKANPFVRCDLQDFAFEGIKYKINSFGWTFAPKKGQIRDGSANGPTLPADLLALMNSVKAGDKLYIENIRAEAQGTKIGAKPVKGTIAITFK